MIKPEMKMNFFFIFLSFALLSCGHKTALKPFGSDPLREFTSNDLKLKKEKKKKKDKQTKLNKKGN